MAFNELELQAIDSTVGAFCRRKSPKQFKDEIRIIYEIDDSNVLMFEERRGSAAWNNPKEWIRTGIARFRYIRSHDHWMLDWMRRDGKWHLYDPDLQKQDLRTLVKIVEEDENGAFFG